MVPIVLNLNLYWKEYFMANSKFHDWARRNQLTMDSVKGSNVVTKSIILANHWCHRVVLLIAQLSMIVMLCTVFVNVILRFCFNSNIPWAEEVPGLLVTLFTFIACCIGVRDHLHISVTMVYNRFKKGGMVRKVMDVMTDVATLACGIIFLVWGIKLIQSALLRPGMLPMTGWPTWLQYVPLPIGGFIMAFDSILFLLGILKWDDLLYSEPEVDYQEILKQQAEENIAVEGGKN